jgi:hypothetical protein
MVSAVDGVPAAVVVLPDVDVPGVPLYQEQGQIEEIPSQMLSFQDARKIWVKWLSTAGNQFNSWGFPQVPHSGPGLRRTSVLPCFSIYNFTTI